MSDTYDCCGAKRSWSRNNHASSCPTRRHERSSWAARSYGRDVTIPEGHDWLTCGCDPCLYKHYWLDRDDDPGSA